MITAKLSVNDMTRIPKIVRQELKLNQGDRIVFEKKEDGYVIRKLVVETPGNKKPAPIWSASKSHTEYAMGDLVLGSDGKTYRLDKMGWQFFDPTSKDGQNSWKAV